MLFNLVAFMVMMQMPKAEIKKKVVVQICNVTFAVRNIFVKFILIMLKYNRQWIKIFVKIGDEGKNRRMNRSYRN